MRFMLGIDEAGRGPLAGPVAVGGVLAPMTFDIAREFPGVTDSKQLTEEVREYLFSMLERRAAEGDVQFKVEFESSESIDQNGIVPAVRSALSRVVGALAPDMGTVKIKLDGALSAPPGYLQETIIRGDEIVPIISLASIAAKVLRDRLMKELAKTYPVYGFEQHKGYGTDGHYEMLRRHGLSPIHRRSFIHLDQAA